ncbi:hypothetical protein P7L53_12120 [Thermoleptolyngbya sichuanensis XZ-Cy5]|uniref:hypothetical protein n=1 Tax=Thermoleptolyngbya sichuanensis TaxID=2885951 RepID=UPI00240D275A|nr:hypothetical protein [Thermoleptolyngbya sichuanensis]MDG2616986.1 hypothetical protein [Thermoleptolyngbya sichuanensis XZ-Cy5]
MNPILEIRERRSGLFKVSDVTLISPGGETAPFRVAAAIREADNRKLYGAARIVLIKADAPGWAIAMLVSECLAAAVGLFDAETGRYITVQSHDRVFPLGNPVMF